MAIDDNTLYGLTGAQVKELPGKIEAVKGLARELTTDDYNYPANNPNGVALWLLEPGSYKGDGSVRVYVDSSTVRTSDSSSYVIMKMETGYIGVLLSYNSRIALEVLTDGGLIDYGISNLLTANIVQDNLTSTRQDFPLSANQGRVLKDLIDSIAIRGAGAPTTSTVGQVGTLYEDTTNGDLYICTDATNPYVWEEVGSGGGSGPTVVQTTGTSTTDVMSQNATTSMVFADPSTAKKVRIGNTVNMGVATDSIAIGAGVSAIGQYATAIGPYSRAPMEQSVAIGQGASAENKWSVAIGDNAHTTNVGEVAIGSVAATGYNNSNYRLLTGLYDPQSDHDAATKGYVDNLTITYAALNGTSAPTTATAGTYVGQLYLDTTNDKMYYLSAIDTVTPEYTWEEIGGGGGLDQNTTFWGQTASNGAVTGRITFGTNGYVNGTNNTVTVYADTAGGADPFEFSHTGLDVASKKITNLAAPTANGDAATKGYVDNSLSGKQDVLTAGSGISITDESGSLVISATGSGGGVIELTTDDYNYPADNPTSVALWLLDDGIYHVATSVVVRTSTYSSLSSGDDDYIILSKAGTKYIFRTANNTLYKYITDSSGDSIEGNVPLSPTVVQEPGGSTKDVMCQAAVTGMVFQDPLIRKKVQIGYYSTAGGDCGVGIGYNATSVGNGAIALGAGSRAMTQGEMNIGSNFTTDYGYNNSNYRLLTGLYDPQSAHDAATKGYVDTAVAGAETSAFTTNEWNALWA